MCYQNNRIFGILVLKCFNLQHGGFSIVKQNEPSVMSSWDFTQVHFDKVFGLLDMFVDDILFNFPHDNRLSFDRS
jgi:hypothetical protein